MLSLQTRVLYLSTTEIRQPMNSERQQSRMKSAAPGEFSQKSEMFTNSRASHHMSCNLNWVTEFWEVP